jgi:hypothetical protein
MHAPKKSSEDKEKEAYKNRGMRRDLAAAAGGDDVDVGGREGAAVGPWCLGHVVSWLINWIAKER